MPEITLEDLEPGYDPIESTFDWELDEVPSLDELIFALAGGQTHAGDDVLGLVLQQFGYGTESWFNLGHWESHEEAQEAWLQMQQMFDQYSYVGEDIEADQFLNQLRSESQDKKSSLWGMFNAMREKSFRRGFGRAGGGLTQLGYESLVEDYNLNRSQFKQELDADIYKLRDAARANFWDLMQTLAELDVPTAHDETQPPTTDTYTPSDPEEDHAAGDEQYDVEYGEAWNEYSSGQEQQWGDQDYGRGGQGGAWGDQDYYDRDDDYGYS